MKRILICVVVAVTACLAAVICGAPHAAGAVSVRLRTSPDGRSWSPWRETPLERAGEAGGPPRAYTEPVWTGAARYVQVTAVAAGGAGSPAALENVRLVAIDPSEDGYIEEVSLLLD